MDPLSTKMKHLYFHNATPINQDTLRLHADNDGTQPHFRIFASTLSSAIECSVGSFADWFVGCWAGHFSGYCVCGFMATRCWRIGSVLLRALPLGSFHRIWGHLAWMINCNVATRTEVEHLRSTAKLLLLLQPRVEAYPEAIHEISDANVVLRGGSCCCSCCRCCGRCWLINQAMKLINTGMTNEI